MKHRLIRRLLAGFLAMVMIVLSAPGLPVRAAGSASADDEKTAAAEKQAEEKRRQDAEMKELNEKISALQDQEQQIRSDIAKTQSAKAQQLANKRALGSQIGVTQDQIQVLEDKIALLEEQIAQNKEEIAALEASIGANYELYKQRMCALYMSGSASGLSVLLGAESFSDLLIQSELMRRVAQHDNDLLDCLSGDKEHLEEVKTGLDANLADLDVSKLELESKKQFLAGQIDTTESKIQEYAADEKAFLAEQDKLVQARQELQAELENIFATMGSIGEYVGGELAWPLPGYYNITCGLGTRFGGTDYHTGIDITGGPGVNVNGKTIIAANTGEVTHIAYAPNAYGNYLIIDHGGGRSTLYGHCSSIDVNVGDRVLKGGPIAKVGSTGWSTGPHLHFEVREGKTAQNPLNYVGG